MKDELAPKVVETGDSSHIELYTILAVLSLGTVALYIHLKKNKGNDSDEQFGYYFIIDSVLFAIAGIKNLFSDKSQQKTSAIQNRLSQA